MGKFIRIVTPHFVAGIDCDRRVAAPILVKPFQGKTIQEITAIAQQLGWGVELYTIAPPPGKPNTTQVLQLCTQSKKE